MLTNVSDYSTIVIETRVVFPCKNALVSISCISLKYIYFSGEQNRDFCPNINEGENKLNFKPLGKLNFETLG